MLNNVGLLVVYLIILGDVSVGKGDQPGVVLVAARHLAGAGSAAATMPALVDFFFERRMAAVARIEGGADAGHAVFRPMLLQAAVGDERLGRQREHRWRAYTCGTSGSSRGGGGARVVSRP